jgi:hypothetical protein
MEGTEKLRQYRRSLSPLEIQRLIHQALGELSCSLEKIGFDDYESYLKSRLWHGIRKRIFGRAKGRCECCGLVPPVNVHHWSYSVATLQGRKPQNLEAVCRACHDQFHAQIPTQRSIARQARKAHQAFIQSGGALGQPKDLTPRLKKPS